MLSGQHFNFVDSIQKGEIMSIFKKHRRKKALDVLQPNNEEVCIENETSKCKKFIRLSPSSSKKRHSKHKDSETFNCEGEPEHSGRTGTSMAKKSDQRIMNGPSDKDIQEFKQAFDMFDKNHDGKISSEELGCVIRTLGHNHSSKEIEEMIKNVDTNENGFVEYDEFLTMMRRASKEQCSENNDEARKREAFAVFDMDGNGYIDKHELKYVMRRLGENLSDEDLKAMFSEADINGDGLIDYDEFSRLNMA